MKYLLFLAALAIFANSANALPVWARLVARSHCEYLEMGATWKQSIRQAMRDNKIWYPEMRSANANGGLATKAITKAVNSLCFDLDQDAFLGLEPQGKEVYPEMPPLPQ